MGKLSGMDKLLNFLNGLSKEARVIFCGACDTTEGYLRNAVSTGKRLGGPLCISIERESKGAVRCEDLSPDADWAFIRASSKRKARAAAPP